jgi:hypothetical protein
VCSPVVDNRGEWGGDSEKTDSAVIRNRLRA